MIWKRTGLPLLNSVFFSWRGRWPSWRPQLASAPTDRGTTIVARRLNWLVRRSRGPAGMPAFCDAERARKFSVCVSCVDLEGWPFHKDQKKAIGGPGGRRRYYRRRADHCHRPSGIRGINRDPDMPGARGLRPTIQYSPPGPGVTSGGRFACKDRALCAGIPGQA